MLLGLRKKRADFAQRYRPGCHLSNVTSKGVWGIDHGCGGWSAFFAVPGMEVQPFGVVGFKIVVLAPRCRLKAGCRLIVTVLQQVLAVAPPPER